VGNRVDSEADNRLALADWNYAAIRNRSLFGDRIRFVVPTGCLKLWNNKSSASVRFYRHEARRIAETEESMK
jgi:hypothetical protein